MASIRLENINKYYGKLKILDNINLKIDDGEFVVLLGPSGCGKTTLLKIISGLESSTSGKLYIDNSIVNNISPRDRNIAMVFQNYALYPHMNVYKNISISLELRKQDKKIIEEKVEKVSKMLDIDELLYKKPKELSGGQMQRVALARAIIREPKIFLMDEPLSNLDAKLRLDTRINIMQLYDKLKTTTVYVTHDQIEAMTMATKIVVMNKGKIIQIGTPDEIYNDPNSIFVASFVGTPKINLLEINNEIGNILNLYDENIIVGIRPEDIELVSGNDFVVDLIENLGNEKIIYLKLNNIKISVRVNSKKNINKGDKFSIKILKYYLFDKLSEERKREY